LIVRLEGLVDPLSDVLALLKPRSYSAGGFGVEGAFSLEFGQDDGIKCYAIESGEGWLAVEGVPEPIHLAEGDCFLLPRGLPFRLATDLSQPPTDALTFLKSPQGQLPWRFPGEGSCFLVGGFFTLTGPNAGSLLQILPPIVHLRSEQDKEELRWCLNRMRQEIREPRPGGALLAQQLACILLVQALRLHLEDGVAGRVGWLFALADRQMNAAITAMHEKPGYRWTLQELAEHAGMSRSIFAERFRRTAGTTAIEYLTRWRMMLAADRLTEGKDGVGQIASALGYESESAFGKAFKRVMGLSPRQYTRGPGPVQGAMSEAQPPRGLSVVADERR
jgi:AraC-like DNA-binding protein